MTFDYEVVAEVCEGAISVLTGDIRTSEYSLNAKTTSIWSALPCGLTNLKDFLCEVGQITGVKAPDPSTYAAILGLLSLGIAFRRRTVAVINTKPLRSLVIYS